MSQARSCTATAALLLILSGIFEAAPGWSAPERSTAACQVALTEGILAFTEGDFATAAQQFEEAVRWDERNGTALHWLGLSYLALGRTEEAVVRLESSLRAALPPEAGRKRVRADLKIAREGLAYPDIEAPEMKPLTSIPGLRSWSASIALEAGSDSNPGLLPETALQIPVVSAGPAQATADEALRLDALVDVHPLRLQRSWSLSASFAGSQAVYRTLGDFDLSLVRATVSAARRTDRAEVVLQGGGSYVLLGGKEYLSVAEAAASLVLRGVTRLDLQVQERSFARDGLGDVRRSGGEVSLAASHSFSLPGKAHTFRGGVLAGLRSGGRAFQSSFAEGFAEADLALDKNWTLSLNGAYRAERFAHPESSLDSRSGSKRRDYSWQLSALLAYPAAVERLRWTARASWLDNDSNVEFPAGLPLFDHRRAEVALGMQWSL